MKDKLYLCFVVESPDGFIYYINTDIRGHCWTLCKYCLFFFFFTIVTDSVKFKDHLQPH